MGLAGWIYFCPIVTHFSPDANIFFAIWEIFFRGRATSRRRRPATFQNPAKMGLRSRPAVRSKLQIPRNSTKRQAGRSSPPQTPNMSTAAFRYSALISPISVPEGTSSLAISTYWALFTWRFVSRRCFMTTRRPVSSISFGTAIFRPASSISIFGLNSPYGSVSASVILIGRPVSVFIRNQ